MKNSFFQSKYHNLITESVKKISNTRTQEIINQRFGLLDGQRKTLEAIGQKYDITRERVRQIENSAFNMLYENGIEKKLNPVFKSIDNFFNQQGQLVREERLLAEVTDTQEAHPYRGSLFLTLALGKPYHRFVESKEFYPFWVNDLLAIDKAKKVIDFLTKKLEKESKTVNINYILDTHKEKKEVVPETVLASYLDATKQIHQNNFGEFGLTNWSEISPRGVKDKAYIVLKQQTKPLHFREVTELINQAGFGANSACPQTVHNELIKDARFVLVGRGIYALTEWGYQPGTVKDIIVNLLKQNNSLAKDEIVKKVLQDRLVKENTILINLQNKDYFVREKNGRYSLKSRG